MKSIELEDLSFTVFHSLNDITDLQVDPIFSAINTDTTDRHDLWLKLLEKTYPDNCRPDYCALYDDRNLVGLSFGTMIYPYKPGSGSISLPASMLLNKFPLCNDQGFFFADNRYIIPFLDHFLAYYSRIIKPSILLIGPFNELEQQIIANSHLPSFISIPYFGIATLDLPFDDFNQFLSSLNKKKRQSIKKNIEHFHASNITWEYCRDTLSCSDHLFKLYMNVVNNNPKTSSPFNLTSRFFKEISPYVGPGKIFEIIMAKENNDIIAFSLLIKKDNVLIMKYLGLDYKKTLQSRVYHNIIYECIRYAIRNRFRKINFGITSLDVKRRLGCNVVHPTINFQIYPRFLHHLVQKSHFINDTFFTRYD